MSIIPTLHYKARRLPFSLLPKILEIDLELIHNEKFIELSSFLLPVRFAFELFLPALEVIPRLLVLTLALFLTSSSLPIAGLDLVLFGVPRLELPAAVGLRLI
mgnify:CR=1 FL=1